MAENTFIDTVVDLKRVTKVTKGGKRFSFSAFVVSGDGQGRVGVGIGKSREVASAISKAVTRARSSLQEFAIRGTTLPYDVTGRHGATQVLIRPAYKGTGLIGGGAVRAVMFGLGVKDILSKITGPSRCGKNVVKATLNALAKARKASHIARLRGKTVAELVRDGNDNAQ